MTQTIHVHLNEPELLIAGLEGVRRTISQLGRPGRRDYDGCRWCISIDGNAAEMAVAKVIDRYWTPTTVDQRHGGDVGGLEIRSTQRSDGSLILHPDDPNDREFVLVTGRAPDLTIVGTISAENGKRREFWREPPVVRHGAFFVPQAALMSLRPTQGSLL